VQAARDDFLARAALAGDEYGRGRRRDPLDHVLHLGQCVAVAGEQRLGVLVARQTDFARRQPACADRLLHDLADLVRIERLREIVERALLQRLDGAAHGAVRREHHHGDLRMRQSHGLEQLEPVHLGHTKIRQDRVDGLAREDLECRATVGRVERSEAVALEQRCEHAPHVRLVLDDQHSARGLHPGSGSETGVTG
jgi:hypothetical protein